ncbi:uncharacterized protein LOC132262443 [Phlebotomus argentipes]|uniref:uncharacterized protein LOC132262443 n=1 Tax=Phlebotomus argentipes TaxID=94469 RepID=UPI00289363F8|nr:uncharacterized protein LOC132262443 [Phlebotomus argentipes]
MLNFSLEFNPCENTVAVDCSKLLHSDGSDTPINAWELQNLGLSELNECLSSIGAKPLDEELAKNVWDAMKSIYKIANAIPRECFKNMGYALVGIPPEDFDNITIGDIEMVEVFGQYRGFNPEQMYAILERVQSDWTEKIPETYSQYDLEALRQILCVMNMSEIERIHADAYKGAAQTIGSLQDCTPEVIQGFAKLAIHSMAFGPPDGWSKLDVVTIGAVVSGLPPDLYRSIPSDNLAKKTDKAKNTVHSDKEIEVKTETMSESM